MLPSSCATRWATTHFSLHVLTNSRYFCRLSKNRKIVSPVATGTLLVVTTVALAAVDVCSNGAPESSGSDKPVDQPIDLTHLFHMRQMPRLFENVDWQASGKRFGVGDRNDPVLTPPDDLDRQFEGGDLTGEVRRLPAIGEPCIGNLRQARRYPVQSLVAQHVLNHPAADEA